MESLHAFFKKVRVRRDETRRVLEHPQQILDHENLTANVRAASYADHGCGSAASDFGCHFRLDALQYDRTTSGVRKFVGFGRDNLPVILRLAAILVSADCMDGLRKKARVPNHGNTDADQLLDRFEVVWSGAFEFHPGCARLLENANCVLHGFFCADLEAPERHVREDWNLALDRAHDDSRMIDDVVHRNGDGRIVALDHVAKAVAHEDEIDIRREGDLRSEKIVRGYGNDLASFTLHSREALSDELASQIHALPTSKPFGLRLIQPARIALMSRLGRG